MLMRPNVVVPAAKLSQQGRQRIKAVDFHPVQFGLERSEQALDLSVLPRAARIGTLVAEAGEREGDAEQAGHEYRFVVRT